MLIEASLLIAVLCLLISIPLAIRNVKNYIESVLISDIFVAKFDDILDDVMQNPETQKRVYSVGALIGNGVKAGIGINPKGGKFKWENILAEIASNWLQGTMNKQTSTTVPPTPTNIEIPTV